MYEPDGVTAVNEVPIIEIPSIVVPVDTALLNAEAIVETESEVEAETEP